jgi:hypothetical protein
VADVPHVDFVYRALRIDRERLNSKSRIAIAPRLLQWLLQALAAAAPFSEEFYLGTYSDLAGARASGQLSDPHRHFIETGFLEGRFGAPPAVDETYYTATYRDVAEAIARGDVASGAEHYMRAGAAEGRVPNRQAESQAEAWLNVLRGGAAVSS